jgi:hypothetical protein
VCAAQGYAHLTNLLQELLKKDRFRHRFPLKSFASPDGIAAADETHVGFTWGYTPQFETAQHVLPVNSILLMSQI